MWNHRRWISRLFERRAPKTYRPKLERLEDRATPATVNYTSASGFLQFVADFGEADAVTVTSSAANTVQIQVGNGDSIVLAGDAIANADFALSTTTSANDTLTITTTASPLTTFQFQLDDQDDSLNFSLANSTNGVTTVNLDGDSGDDSIQFGNTNTAGGLTAAAESITFAANAALVAATNDIFLTTTDNAATGQDLILDSGMSLTATAGGVSLFAGDDVILNSGASMVAGTTIALRIDVSDQDVGTGAALEINGTVTANSVTATGGNDADALTITPSSNTSISAIGGLPTASVGDSLTFNLSGASDPFLQTTFVTGDSSDGIASFSNRENVTWVSIEDLPQIDVSVAASDDPDPAVANGTLTLTVTVTNNGTLGVKGIAVTDTFPAEFTGATWTAVFSGTGSTGNTSGSGNLNETIDLAAGGSVTYTITGIIDASFSGTMSNTTSAALPSGIIDPDLTDNDGSTDTTVVQGSDLNVAVSDSPDPVLINGTLTYTITLTNDGPVAATGIVGTNTLPASVTFQSANATKGSFLQAGSSVTWTLGDLADNESATLTIVVAATQAGIITNSFEITSVHVDPNLNNNSADTDTTVKLPSLTVVGASVNNPPRVQVLDGETGAVRFSFDAYTTAFRGGVHVAMGDMNGDGVADIITGAGPGGGPHVRIFDGVNGNPLTHPLSSFFAYDPAFSGGVFVAVGDVNDDNVLDVITGAGFGGGPHVIARSGVDGSILLSFFAYTPGFLGGVRVASGDVNLDDRDDIITGAGAGGGPHVIVYSGQNGAILDGYYAYTSSFTGGVFVAAGDVNGDGRADIITGAGAGGGPHVRAFSGLNRTQLHSFMAFDPGFSGGVTVGAADSNNDAQVDIIAGQGRNGDRRVRIFSGSNLAEVVAFSAFDASFLGGIFVGGR